MGERRFLDPRVLTDGALKLLSPPARYFYLELLLTSPNGRVNQNGGMSSEMKLAMDEMIQAGLMEVRPRSVLLTKYKRHMKKPSISDYAAESSVGLSEAPKGLPKVSYEESRLAWNKIASTYGFPQIREMTDKRKILLRKALAETPDLWARVGAEMAQISDFALRGTWLTFDWIMRKSNRLKLLEGNYRKREQKTKAETEMDRILGELQGERENPEVF